MSEGYWRQKEEILKEQREAFERRMKTDKDRDAILQFNKTKRALADAEKRYNEKLRYQKDKESRRLSQLTLDGDKVY